MHGWNAPNASMSVDFRGSGHYSQDGVAQLANEVSPLQGVPGYGTVRGMVSPMTENVGMLREYSSLLINSQKNDWLGASVYQSHLR